MNITDHLEGFKGEKEHSWTSKKKRLGLSGWEKFVGLHPRTRNMLRVLDGNIRACLAWSLMLPSVGLILRPFQFMAVLFFMAHSALHRISFCYDNTLLGFVLFYSWKRSQHSGALELLSKIALNRCCRPGLRLLGFFSWERRPDQPGGVQRGAGCRWSGQLVCGEDVAHFASLI